MKYAIPLLVLALATLASPSFAKFVANGREHSGQQIAVDLPDTQHMRNTTGRGLGLCVFTALEMAARYQNVEEVDGYQEWMTHRLGGGHPAKVDSTLTQFCGEKGKTVPQYIQHTGKDLSFLRLALATGRYPSVTYSGQDGVHYRFSIAHMVNLVHLSDEWACIQDNNFPGEYLWMTPQEFADRWDGWAVVFCGPPPSPIPVN
jgi:hypothetical protein